MTPPPFPLITKYFSFPIPQGYVNLTPFPVYRCKEVLSPTLSGPLCFFFNIMSWPSLEPPLSFFSIVPFETVNKFPFSFLPAGDFLTLLSFPPSPEIHPVLSASTRPAFSRPFFFPIFHFSPSLVFGVSPFHLTPHFSPPPPSFLFTVRYPDSPHSDTPHRPLPPPFSLFSPPFLCGFSQGFSFYGFSSCKHGFPDGFYSSFRFPVISFAAHTPPGKENRPVRPCFPPMPGYPSL